jgi:hypothetical protein
VKERELSVPVTIPVRPAGENAMPAGSAGAGAPVLKTEWEDGVDGATG